MSASIVAIPIEAEYSAVEKHIEQYLLQLFLKYKQTDIPGDINMSINVTASSSARELAIEYKCAVGPWNERQEFKSNCMTTSLKKACERYQEARVHRVLAISATPSDAPEDIPY